MLTKEDDVEIHALAARGWTKAAIARGRDRKTIQKYLARPVGAPGRERGPSCLEPFRGYVEARFVDDPHVDATVLYRELAGAGFDRSYPTLHRRALSRDRLSRRLPRRASRCNDDGFGSCCVRSCPQRSAIVPPRLLTRLAAHSRRCRRRRWSTCRWLSGRQVGSRERPWPLREGF
jgi:hypothetical protein